MLGFYERTLFWQCSHEGVVQIASHSLCPLHPWSSSFLWLICFLYFFAFFLTTCSEIICSFNYYHKSTGENIVPTIEDLNYKNDFCQYYAWKDFFLNKRRSKPKPDDRKSYNQALMKNCKTLCAEGFYFQMKNNVFEKSNFIYNFLFSHKPNFPLKKLAVRNLPPTLARNPHVINCS